MGTQILVYTNVHSRPIHKPTGGDQPNVPQ